MRQFIRGFATVAALAAGVAMIGTGTEAAAIPALGGLRMAIDTMALTENVQLYVYEGRRYCWYDDGWRGPGWYWCGYQSRRGYGWGGGYAGTAGAAVMPGVEQLFVAAMPGVVMAVADMAEAVGVVITSDVL